ncbi:MAG: outer membrane beta-barrel protein [Bacteroidota bacterium]
MIRIVTIVVMMVSSLLCNGLKAQTLEKGSHNFGVGLTGGIVIGDFEDAYSSNIGVEAVYFYGLTDRISIGASTGFTNYFGDDFTEAGITTEVDDAQFIPLTGSFRFSPFPKFFVGGDIGYAIGINDGNDGGFYASPRANYLIADKFIVNAGYRLIDLDGGSLGAIQFGIGYKF